MVDSSHVEMFNKAHDLVESIGKMDGPIRSTLKFLFNKMWVIIQEDSKHTVESLTDATNMVRMAISDPAYAQDYYEYHLEERGLINANKRDYNELQEVKNDHETNNSDYEKNNCKKEVESSYLNENQLKRSEISYGNSNCYSQICINSVMDISLEPKVYDVCMQVDGNTSFISRQISDPKNCIITRAHTREAPISKDESIFNDSQLFVSSKPGYLSPIPELVNQSLTNMSIVSKPKSNIYPKIS